VSVKLLMSVSKNCCWLFVLIVARHLWCCMLAVGSRRAS